MMTMVRTAAVMALTGFLAGPAFAAHGAEQALTYIVPAASESTEGQVIPDVLLQDGSGMPIHLGRYVGFVLVLSFWSEKCGPCLKQMPYLDRLQGNFRGRKLLVLPVSVDSGGAPAAKAFFVKNHYSFLRPYADPGGTMARMLGVTGLPTTLIIDRKGMGVARAEGVRVWDSDEMMGRLNWLLVRP